MNKDLRHSYICNNWDCAEVLIQYLRERGAFSHRNGDAKANPYWHGSTYGYSEGEKIVQDLLDKKSLKPSRLKRMLDSMSDDLNGPIVRIAGMALKRKFFP